MAHFSSAAEVLGAELSEHLPRGVWHSILCLQGLAMPKGHSPDFSLHMYYDLFGCDLQGFRNIFQKSLLQQDDVDNASCPASPHKGCSCCLTDAHSCASLKPLNHKMVSGVLYQYL